MANRINLFEPAITRRIRDLPRLLRWADRILRATEDHQRLGHRSRIINGVQSQEAPGCTQSADHAGKPACGQAAHSQGAVDRGAHRPVGCQGYDSVHLVRPSSSAANRQHRAEAVPDQDPGGVPGKLLEQGAQVVEFTHSQGGRSV